MSDPHFCEFITHYFISLLQIKFLCCISGMAVYQDIAFFSGIVISILHEHFPKAPALMHIVYSYLTHLDSMVSGVSEYQRSEQFITFEETYMQIICILSQIILAEGQPERYAQYLVTQDQRQEILRVALSEYPDLHLL